MGTRRAAQWLIISSIGFLLLENCIFFVVGTLSDKVPEKIGGLEGQTRIQISSFH
jgi:hypothetical protein